MSLRKFDSQQMSIFSLQTIDKDDDFDPFANRQLQRPTNDLETLVHLLKSVLGSGILLLPFAFKTSGILTGLVLMIIVSIVCINCSYILVKSAHVLYKKERKTQMSYDEVTYQAFRHGPQPIRKYARVGQFVVKYGLFTAYFGTCSAYSSIIAQNLKKVFEQYVPIDVSIRLYIAFLLIPTIPLCWIPDLKSLAKASLLSNILMIFSLSITCYYIFIDFKDLSDIELIGNNFWEWPTFISIAIFAMEATGITMSLENNMKTPQNYLGSSGVLVKAMVLITVLYSLFGIVGYMTYGEQTDSNISSRVPNDFLGNLSRITISISVLLTFVLLFFVCFEIIWKVVKPKITKNESFFNYGTRTLLVTVAILLAVAVPSIKTLVNLISAICFSILGVFMPAMIETLVFWESGFGLDDWKLYKNFIIFLFSFINFFLGTKTALSNVIEDYF